MFKTKQEEFWSGEFGNEYVERNRGGGLLAGDISLFSDIFKHTNGVENGVIEFGCNIGLNLMAIRKLFPTIPCAGIEINKKAAQILEDNVERVKVFRESILVYEPREKYSMSLIKGVLIHINPNELQDVYQKLYDSSDKYICIAEYYNPTPMEIDYRGHKERLFKRDFAGEFMDKFPDTKLIDYGFTYHRDNNYEYDDITWFLLSK